MTSYAGDAVIDDSDLHPSQWMDDTDDTRFKHERYAKGIHKWKARWPVHQMAVFYITLCLIKRDVEKYIWKARWPVHRLRVVYARAWVGGVNCLEWPLFLVNNVIHAE